MISKGIRGAITVDENSEAAIKSAVVQLLGEILRRNNLSEGNLSHIIFTVTSDLDAAFPAKFARIDLGLKKTAMMCYNEAVVKFALPLCLRIMVVANCSEDFVPEFVYLKGAEMLRENY